MDIRVNFTGRTGIHDPFAEERKYDLKRWGLDVAENGREITHRGLNLNHSNDIGSRLVRFAPDIAAMWNTATFYIDAKASVFIEKDPYNHYKWMADEGLNVYVVSKNKSQTIRFSHINDLAFLPAEHHVWPIDDDGWIAPREHHNYELLKRHFPNGYLYEPPYPGSGTPFRKVQFGEMSDWLQMLFIFDLSSRKWQ